MFLTDTLKRIRRTFAPGLTAANLLDRALASHDEQSTYHLMTPLPYPGMRGRTLGGPQVLGFVNRVGNILLQAGMRRFDRVAIFKTNSPDYFFLGMAIIKAGGISVPINSGMSLTELRHYLEHMGVRILITDEATFAGRIKDASALPMISTWVFPQAPDSFPARHVDLCQALPRAPERLEPVQLNDDSHVLIVHTSGTTGFPKGVINTSGNLIQSLRAYVTCPLSTGTRVATAIPFNHQAAHVIMTLGLFDQVHMWSLDRFDAREVLELLQRERLQCFIGFSDAYLRMYEEGLDGYDLSSVRFWLNSADAAHDVHMRAFTRRGVCLSLFGKPLLRSIFFDGLGASEVGTAGVARAVFSFTRPTFRRRVGRSWPFGPRAKVADEHGHSLPPGQVGGFMVRGGTVFNGYWNAHEKLHGNLQDGWWRTGDVGYRDRLGRFYHLDRAVDVIHTSAGPVYSLLWEELLLSHPDVSEVAVIGVPKPLEGSVPVAVMYPKRGHTLDVEAIRAWANERSRQVRGLERVIAVEREGIPRGLTGKVLKRVLRERYAHLFSSSPRAIPAEGGESEVGT